MIILGIDTTAKHCTAAIVDNVRVLSSRSEPMGRGHAERLAPMVQEVLKSANLSVSDIDKIVVCTGPGSFTGLRVALAFAKGFALPRKIPVVGVNALKVWAQESDAAQTQKIVCISDVRRGQLCWSAFDKGVCIQDPITETTVSAWANIAKLSPDKIIEDHSVNGAILAWIGTDLSPKSAPALPLYSRPPDAKLPGGITLQTS